MNYLLHFGFSMGFSKRSESVQGRQTGHISNRRRNCAVQIGGGKGPSAINDADGKFRIKGSSCTQGNIKGLQGI